MKNFFDLLPYRMICLGLMVLGGFSAYIFYHTVAEILATHSFQGQLLSLAEIVLITILSVVVIILGIVAVVVSIVKLAKPAKYKEAE